jgi:hypothetical protein
VEQPQKIDWNEQEFTEFRPGIFGATVHTPQLSATLYRYGAGSSWEEHQHAQDQITTVLSGTIDFVVDGAHRDAPPARAGSSSSRRSPGAAATSSTVPTPRPRGRSTS